MLKEKLKATKNINQMTNKKKNFNRKKKKG